MSQLRSIAIAAALFAFAAPWFTGTATAQPSNPAGSNAVCNVKMTVDPNVSIVPIDLNIDAGTVQTGDRSALCRFRVDANSEQLMFMVRATNLYKAGIFFNSAVDPIPLDLSKGAIVQPTNGNATNFHSNTLGFVGPCICVNGLPSMRTEFIQFESSQSGVFSQEVDVTVTWLQADPEKPQGEYTGFVQLVAWIMPSDLDTP